MRRHLWILGAVAIAGASGCSQGGAVHDKDYFTARDAERTATIAECQKNPGQEAANANCVNAVAAQAEIDRKKAYTVTPPASRQSDPGKL
jgi:hypothetical protein